MTPTNGRLAVAVILVNCLIAASAQSELRVGRQRHIQMGTQTSPPPIARLLGSPPFRADNDACPPACTHICICYIALKDGINVLWKQPEIGVATDAASGDIIKTDAATSWTAGVISSVGFSAADSVIGVKFIAKGTTLNLMVGL